MKKINLTYEILKRMGIRAIDDDRLTYVAMYYLNEAITKIFGKYEFNEDEIDLFYTNGVLEVKTIFTEGTYEINNFNVNSISFIKDNQVLFEISNTEEGIICQYNNQIGMDIKTVSFENEAKFTLEKNEGEVPTFKCSLTPINAKYRDNELFLLEREIPEQKKNSSLLRRMYESLMDETIVPIKTDYSIDNIMFFTENVFDRLETEYIKEVSKSK